MFRATKFAAGSLVLVFAVNVAALAAVPLQDSDCLTTGSWNCLAQARRLCNYKGTPCATNTCVGCNDGPTTLPAKMCFIVEGKTCTPGSTQVICALKYSNAKCVVEDGTKDCICEVTAPPDRNGKCTFTSCGD